MSPTSVEEYEYMTHIAYVSAVGSLMYAMVCIKPALSQAVSMVSRYMHDLGRGSLGDSEVDSRVHQRYHRC